MTDSRCSWMLIAMGTATFVVTASGSATAPFLPAMAADLGTDISAVAHLFSAQAVMWGASALVFGLLSRRVGRRKTLVGGVFLMGLVRMLFAASGSYGELFSWQLVSGACGGAYMGVVFATASDHVPAGARGRALSWIIMGQSLSLLVGVPAVTLLGALGGWRYALGVHGVATMLVALGLRAAVPPDVAGEPDPNRPRAPLASLLRFRLVALMSAGTAERVCYATLAVYLPTFLQRAYAVSLPQLALALALVAAGNLLGNLVGGRLADRSRSRREWFAASLGLAAVVAFPALTWKPGVVLSVLLGFAFSFVNATGRPSLMVVLSEMPSEVRGALFGLNITMGSVGWLFAGSAGALLLSVGGFSWLGGACAAVAALGAALALASRNSPSRDGASKESALPPAISPT